MSDNLETIREIENIVTDFSNKDIVKVFQLSFVNGHDWDYDAGLVRTVLLDMYEKREGVEAAESLRATVLDK